MRVLRILALSLATLAVHGGAAATVPEAADEAGAAFSSVPSVAAVRRSGETDAPLRALSSLRYVSAERLRAARAGDGSHTGAPAGRPPARAPGSWALLVAGLAGVWAIGRRRLSSIADRRIARYRKWRD